MALYTELPLYKASYDLLLRLYQLSKGMDRDYKFTLGEKIKTEVTDLILLIYRANSTADKKPLLQSAKEKVENIRLFLRIYNDLKQISLQQFVELSEKIESISKQVVAWHNSVKT